MFDKLEPTLFCAPRRALFGCGSLQSIAAEARRLDAGRILVVTDPGVLSAGIVDEVRCLLEPELTVQVYSGVQANPTMQNVAEGLLALEGPQGAPVVVGVGGAVR